jgi:hypothetical protein
MKVLGDYGAGPNHVLPTSGTARYTGGLSVFTFLRIRTFINIERKEEAQDVVRNSAAVMLCNKGIGVVVNLTFYFCTHGTNLQVKDCVALARIEGLEVIFRRQT